MLLCCRDANSSSSTTTRQPPHSLLRAEHLLHALEKLPHTPRTRIRHGSVPDLVLVDVGGPARLGVEVARRLGRFLGRLERLRKRLGVRWCRREGEDEGRERVDERARGRAGAGVLVERVEGELRACVGTQGSGRVSKRARKIREGAGARTSSPRAHTSCVASLASWSLAASSKPLLSPLSRIAYSPPLVPPMSFSTTAEMATMAATTSSSGTRLAAIASWIPSAPALSVSPASPSPAIVS